MKYQILPFLVPTRSTCRVDQLSFSGNRTPTVETSLKNLNNFVFFSFPFFSLLSLSLSSPHAHSPHCPFFLPFSSLVCFPSPLCSILISFLFLFQFLFSHFLFFHLFFFLFHILFLFSFWSNIDCMGQRRKLPPHCLIPFVWPLFFFHFYFISYSHFMTSYNMWLNKSHTFK